MTHPYARVAIAGAFNTEQSKYLPGHDDISIAVKAAKGVVAATGIDVDEIDGVIGRGAEMAYVLGLNSIMVSDKLGIGAVLEAAQAIEAGACTTVLVVCGGAGSYTDRNATAPWTRPPNEWVLPFGMYTAAEFALMARRHMHVYGTTEEQLATVAATIRNNGSLNPQASHYGKGPYTADDVLASRMIADPFHLLDCAITSEGGCAIIVTSLDRAMDLRLPPVPHHGWRHRPNGAWLPVRSRVGSVRGSYPGGPRWIHRSPCRADYVRDGWFATY